MGRTEGAARTTISATVAVGQTSRGFVALLLLAALRLVSVASRANSPLHHHAPTSTAHLLGFLKELLDRHRDIVRRHRAFFIACNWRKGMLVDFLDFLLRLVTDE
jgi:hypothetical protein